MARIIRKQHAYDVCRHIELLQKAISTNKYLAFREKAKTDLTFIYHF